MNNRKEIEDISAELNFDLTYSFDNYQYDLTDIKIIFSGLIANNKFFIKEINNYYIKKDYLNIAICAHKMLWIPKLFGLDELTNLIRSFIRDAKNKKFVDFYERLHKLDTEYKKLIIIGNKIIKL